MISIIIITHRKPQFKDKKNNLFSDYLCLNLQCCNEFVQKKYYYYDYQKALQILDTNKL